MVFRYKLYSPGKGFLRSLSVTNQLILANILFFIVSLVVLSTMGQDFFIKNISLNTENILNGESIWTFLTSMFSHVSFFHIFANMFSLFFIGNFLEKIIGRKRFFWVYLVAGFIGGLFFVASDIIFSQSSSGIGASGAVFGILGVLAVLVPYSKIYLIVGPLILIFAQFIISPFLPTSLLTTFSFIINVLILMMIFSLLSFNPVMTKFAVPLRLPMWVLPIIAIVPLSIYSLVSIYNPAVPGLPIGNSAHIGGLFLGLIYGFYLKKKFPRKTNMIMRHFK